MSGYQLVIFKDILKFNGIPSAVLKIENKVSEKYYFIVCHAYQGVQDDLRNVVTGGM